MSDPTPEPAPAEEQPKRTRPRIGGKMFGLMVGTLKKASHDDKVLRASEAAKKRQLLESQLAAKLRNESAVVRRKEDTRRNKLNATRMEEGLGVKDSVAKLRRKRIPMLANFLCTAGEDLNVRRGHPPPVFYLPKVLLPEQEDVLARRRQKAAEMVESEWAEHKEARTEGVREIEELRLKVSEAVKEDEEAEEQDKDSMDVDTEKKSNGKDEKKPDDAMDDSPVEPTKAPSPPPQAAPAPAAVETTPSQPAEAPAPVAEEKEDVAMQADEDEVEY